MWAASHAHSEQMGSRSTRAACQELLYQLMCFLLGRWGRPLAAPQPGLNSKKHQQLLFRLYLFCPNSSLWLSRDWSWCWLGRKRLTLSWKRQITSGASIAQSLVRSASDWSSFLLQIYERLLARLTELTHGGRWRTNQYDKAAWAHYHVVRCLFEGSHVSGVRPCNFTRVIMAVFRRKDSDLSDKNHSVQNFNVQWGYLDFFRARQKFWRNLLFTSASWLDSSSAKCWKRRRNTS